MKRMIGLLLILLGIGVLLLPVLAYIQGVQSQQELERQWEKAAAVRKTAPLPKPEETAPLPEPEKTVPLPKPVKTAALPKHSKLKPIRRATHHELAYAGFPPTRLLIPKIGLDAMVVEGTSLSALKRGPGHFKNTAMPGTSGNCCIAGHRNMYGWWFYSLNRLSSGDSVILSTPDRDFTYRVKRIFTVPPNETSVIGPRSGHVLTLITCTPVPRPTHRLVVVAEMENSNSAVL